MSKYGMAEHALLIRLLKRVEKISFDFADHVITINEPIQDLLIRRGLRGSKSSVVMNAVDEARFAAAATPRGTEVAQARDRFVMMYHGTLTRIYGLDLAVEAFSQAHTDMPDAELWILGSGPELTGLKELAHERGLGEKVRLVGQVPADEIPAWLSRCNLGLLPIRRDVFLDFAFPNKLPEFIVAGKPVLISRLAAVRHYFSDEALAFFNPNDATDLAAQMVRLARDRGLRERLVAGAAREYAPIRWDLMKQRYLRVIEDVAGSARGTDRRSTAKTSALAG
jgi:glycosyltransferase involved in cell wall biosynthesis